MTTDRRGRTRDIPEAVKRRLRQESGFGCCKCGHPLYQYHHIVPYSEVQEDNPETMLTLCPNHHEEADAEAITRAEQITGSLQVSLFSRK